MEGRNREGKVESAKEAIETDAEMTEDETIVTPEGREIMSTTEDGMTVQMLSAIAEIEMTGETTTVEMIEGIEIENVTDTEVMKDIARIDTAEMKDDVRDLGQMRNRPMQGRLQRNVEP